MSENLIVQSSNTPTPNCFLFYIFFVRSFSRYKWDTRTGLAREVGDMTTACGEAGRNTIAQGKVHVDFVEHAGQLYFATHVGVYDMVDGMETFPTARDGLADYPGGHLLSYDVAREEFTDLATVTTPWGREGVLTLNMDSQRGTIYGLTWPTGDFFTFQLRSRILQCHGNFSAQGESVPPHTGQYRCICRSLGIDPRDGSVYFTNAEGSIFRYDFTAQTVENFMPAAFQKVCCARSRNG